MKALETKIYQTMDYDLFISEKTNRVVSKGHVMKLVSSISKRNLLIDEPILVMKGADGKYYVINGQHRLQACIELNIPVWYRFSKEATTDDVKTFNVYSKNWISSDFLNFYCKKGKINYIKFNKFFIWSGLRSVDACIKLFSGNYWEFTAGLRFDSKQSNGTRTYNRGASKSVDFKNGNFLYPADDSEERDHILKIKSLAEKLFMAKWDNVSLWCVYFNVILGTPEYEHSRMLKQLEKYPVVEFKKGFSNASLCVEVLQEIYNKGVRFEKQFLFNKNKLS